MKIKDAEKPISFDDALLMPEYAHLHEVIRYLENTPDSEIFSRKYEMGMEHIASKKINSLFKEDSSIALKNVVSAVLERLPNNISAELLLKITLFTIKKWENLSNSASQRKNIKELV